jgi:hypothetical protein
MRVGELGCRTLVVFKGAGFPSLSSKAVFGVVRRKTRTLRPNHEQCGTRRSYPLLRGVSSGRTMKHIQETFSSGE